MTFKVKPTNCFDQRQIKFKHSLVKIHMKKNSLQTFKVRQLKSHFFKIYVLLVRKKKGND